MENYYEILGVSETASIEDIKKAYRKLAKEWHPDVNEAKEAEAKFKKITEAYNILSDETEKNKYDRTRRNPGGHSGFFDMNMGGGMQEMFDRMFGGFPGGAFTQMRPNRRENENIIEQISITPQETLKPIRKTKSYQRKMFCEDCEGTGGHDFEKCPACDGQGQQIQQHSRGGNVFVTQSTCQACGGHGKKSKKTCDPCRGRGYSLKQESIELDIIPAHFGRTLELAGSGHFAYPETPPGSLLIQINLVESKGFTPIDLNGTVEFVAEINPVISIIGGEYTFNNLEGSKCKISIPPSATEGKKLKIDHQGMMNAHGNRGNLIAIIKYKIPSIISKKQRDLLQEYMKISQEN